MNNRNDPMAETVIEIPLADLYSFKNHPFKVQDDETMLETAESIRNYGVLVPGIVRPRPEGGYEIISGHRRKRASELAGKETMPVIVRNLDDDEAAIIMVDSNLQRDNILPSERSRAYKIKLEAIKHQGERTDLTSSQVGTKLKTDERIALQVGSSRNQVHRYIRLTHLITPLLDLVDEKKIAFNPAVELSYLPPEQQYQVWEAISMQQSTPSLSQAQRIKKHSQEGKLTSEMIIAIMSEEKKSEMNRPPFMRNEGILSEEGFIKLPITPFLQYLPRSLLQNPSPEAQEKLTKFFLKTAELYKKYIAKKRQQER